MMRRDGDERAGGLSGVGAWMLAGLLVAGGLSGCSGSVDGDASGGEAAADEEGDYGRLAQPIKGGKVDKKTKAIVGIYSKRHDGKRGRCTGTLVAPNLVLTARHCVNDVNAAPGVPCSKARFGKKHKSFRVTTNTRMHGQATYYHDAGVYRPSGDKFCGRDIALIRLKKSIPAAEAKPIEPRLKRKVEVGDSYAAVGFGRDGSNGNGGVRRRLDGQTIQCLGKACGPSRMTAEEFIGDGPACHGDSGGGAVAPNRQVIGVTSRAGKDCKWTMFTSVHAWRNFIQTSAADAAKKGGYPAPAWTNTGPDGDGDGYADGWDNCPKVANKGQVDDDGDGTGNPCDTDRDGDGTKNGADNCPQVANKGQGDIDGDGSGDPCDDDRDGDGTSNTFDNCPEVANPNQMISDADGTGDACDDSDEDGVMDEADNCLMTPNKGQADSDGDGEGDACDETPLPDGDGDGMADEKDNCPMRANAGQADSDGDGEGDVCDATPMADAGGMGDAGSDAGGPDGGTMADGGQMPDSGMGQADAGTSGDVGVADSGGSEEEILIVDEPKADSGGCSVAGRGDGPAVPWGGLVAGVLVLGAVGRRE